MEASSFNKDYANKVSKDQWFEDHKQLGTQDELNEVYNQLVEKPKADKKADKAS